MFVPSPLNNSMKWKNYASHQVSEVRKKVLIHIFVSQVKRETLYDDTTSLKMTSSSGDGFTAGTEVIQPGTRTTSHRKNLFLIMR